MASVSGRSLDPRGDSAPGPRDGAATRYLLTASGVQRDAAEVGRSFVDAAADFMESYEAVFAEEFDTAPGERGGTSGSGTGSLPAA